MRVAPTFTFAALLVGCGAPPDAEAPTYYADAKQIIDQRCATCHQSGDIGPFALTTYDEVYQVRQIAAMAVESGRMPPFMPRPPACG